MSAQGRRRLESLALAPGAYAELTLERNDIVDVVSVALGEGTPAAHQLCVLASVGVPGEEVCLARLTPGRCEQAVLHFRIPGACRRAVLRVAAQDEPSAGRESVEILLEHTSVYVGALDEDLAALADAERELDAVGKLAAEVEARTERSTALGRVGSIIHQKQVLREASRGMRERLEDAQRTREQRDQAEREGALRREARDRHVLATADVRRAGSTLYTVLEAGRPGPRARKGDVVTVVLTSRHGEETPTTVHRLRIGAPSNVPKGVVLGLEGMAIGEVRRLLVKERGAGGQRREFVAALQEIRMDDE